MIVLSLYNPKIPEDLIDVFIDEPIPFLKAYKRRLTIKDGSLKISVSSIEDLITMKKKAGRPQDLQDIKELKWRLKNQTR